MAVDTKELHKLYISLLNRTADNTGFNYWNKINLENKENFGAEKFASFFLQDREAKSQFELIKKIQEAKANSTISSLKDDPLASDAVIATSINEALTAILEDRSETGLLNKFAIKVYENAANEKPGSLQKAQIASIIGSVFKSEPQTEAQIYEALGKISTQIVAKYANKYTENAVIVSQSIVDQLNSLQVSASTKVNADGIYDASSAFRGLLTLASAESKNDLDKSIESVIGAITTADAAKERFNPNSASSEISLEKYKGVTTLIAGTADDDTFTLNLTATNSGPHAAINGNEGNDELLITIGGSSTSFTIGKTANNNGYVFENIKNIEKIVVNADNDTGVTTLDIAGDKNVSSDKLIVQGKKTDALANITAENISEITIDQKVASTATVTGSSGYEQTLNLGVDQGTINVTGIEKVVLGSKVKAITVKGDATDETVVVNSTTSSVKVTLENVNNLVFGSSSVDSIEVGAATGLKSVAFGSDGNDSVKIATGQSLDFKVSGQGTVALSGNAGAHTVNITAAAGDTLTLDTTGIAESSSFLDVSVNGTDANDTIKLKLGKDVGTAQSGYFKSITVDLGSGGKDTVDLSSLKKVKQIQQLAASTDYTSLKDAVVVKNFGIGDNLIIKDTTGKVDINVVAVDSNANVGKVASANKWVLNVLKSEDTAYLVYEGDADTASVKAEDLIIKLAGVDSTLIAKWRSGDTKKFSIENGHFVGDSGVSFS